MHVMYIFCAILLSISVKSLESVKILYQQVYLLIKMESILDLWRKLL